jgi:hypothetical protein
VRARILPEPVEKYHLVFMGVFDSKLRSMRLTFQLAGYEETNTTASGRIDARSAGAPLLPC